MEDEYLIHQAVIKDVKRSVYVAIEYFNAGLLDDETSIVLLRGIDELIRCNIVAWEND